MTPKLILISDLLTSSVNCLAMSVLATWFANSSKDNLPSLRNFAYSHGVSCVLPQCPQCPEFPNVTSPNSPILIRLHDRLVDNLLQLLVLQVVSHHHLEHQEQLSVANQPIAVHVIHFECEFQLLVP